MYYPEVTLARAIACIGVVILHASLALYGTDKTLLIIIADVFRFSTPLYVAISGFLLAQSSVNVSLFSFMARKIKFLVPPFLIWGVIYLYGFNNTFSESLKDVLLGQTKGHLYFVPLILQYYLIYYYIKRYKLINSPTYLCLSVSLTFVWFIFFNSLDSLTGDARLIFPSLIFAFAIGYCLGENPVMFREPKPTQFINAALIGALSFVALIYYSINSQTIIPTWHVISLFYGGSMIFVIFYVASQIKKMPLVLDRISKYSFSIYLSHWLCLDIINALINYNLNTWAKLLILVLGTLLMSYCIGFLGNKLPGGYLWVGRATKQVIDRQPAKDSLCNAAAR